MSPKRLTRREFWARHRGAIGYLVLAFVVFYLYNSQQQTAQDSRDLAAKAAHLAKQGARTHTGVCRLRDDLRVRVENSEEFLREHPDGIPGLPAKVIQTGIDGQKRTIRSLRVIGPCPP
jgi:hypothetical protein